MSDAVDPSSLINLVTSVLGHLPWRSKNLQKNVAEDVMLKLMEILAVGHYKEDEVRRLLDGLTVDKTHSPNNKKLSIYYERD